MADNRSRVLSEVVSLDAWHAPFSATRNTSAVSVEISFREGRLGGDLEDFPFTFKVSLKRARLVVRLEEPLRIEKSSVARNIPNTQIEQTKIRSVRNILASKLGAGGSIDLSEFNSMLFGSVSSNRESTREDELRVVQTLPPILVSSEPLKENEYAWSLEPTYLNTLTGQPWDPVESPRLSARYDHHALPQLHPVINAEITCAMEDLLIEDIRPKNPALAERLVGRFQTDSRTLAAQQHLRHVLRSANLEPGGMDNRFASLLIASVLATVET